MIRIPDEFRGAVARRQAVRTCTLLVALLPAMGTAGAQPVSPAEVLLFETDHLARLKAPAALLYDFRKVSNVEPGFTDTVELALSRAKGRTHARLRFLSGERKRELPDVEDARGNPVLLGFLERDIAEMKRLTGGSTTYFRKRIRMALANAAQVTRQPITFQGKTFDGQAVRIQPYLDDPMRARFEQYVHKTYTFVMSDGVPGGVYRITSSLANSGGGKTISAKAGAAAMPGKQAGAAGASPPDGSAAVIEETLTLVKVADPQR